MVTRLIISSFLLVLTFLVKQGIVHYQMIQEENTSYIINIAGRQRMLSQKITKDLAFIHYTNADNYLGDLQNSLEELDQRQNELIDMSKQDKIIGRENSVIQKMYDDLNPSFQGLLNASNSYLMENQLDRPNINRLNQSLKNLVKDQEIYLDAMDEIVFTYEEEAREDLIFIKQLNLFLFVVILLISLFIFLHIIIPLIKNTLETYLSLKSIKKELLRILENMEGIFILVNSNRQIYFMNQAAKKLLGIKGELPKNLSIVDKIEWLNFDILAFLHDLEVNEKWGEEIEVLVEDQEQRIIPMSLSTVSGYYSEEEIIILSLHDLTKQKNAEEILKKLAIRDELTGLYNRHILETILDKEFTQADQFEIPLSIAILDLDHFKKVNDYYGHPIGDNILKNTSKLIQEYIYESYYAVRVGGEEIIIFMPNTNIKEAEKIAEGLRKQLEIFKHSEVGQVTASFGVVERQIGEDYLSLYNRVDDALYLAKKGGRNKVCAL